MEMQLFYMCDEVGFIGVLEVWYICVFVTEHLDSLVTEYLDNYIGVLVTEYLDSLVTEHLDSYRLGLTYNSTEKLNITQNFYVLCLYTRPRRQRPRCPTKRIYN